MQSIPFRRPVAQLGLLGLAMLLIAGLAMQPRAARPRAFEGGISASDLERRLGPTSAAVPVAQAGETGLAWASDLAPSQALAALQSRAAGPLDVHWAARSGIPDWLAAADPSQRIPYTPSAAERGNPLAIARGFLDENRALFRLRAAADELALIRVEPDPQAGFKHVRLGQVYHGIPVFGKQLVVHLDARDQVVAVNGQFSPGMDVPTQPTLGAREAERLAVRELLESQLDPGEAARAKPIVLPAKTALAIYADDAGRPALTWRVAIVTYAPLGEWLVFVNARRPAIAHVIAKDEGALRRQTYTADSSTDLPGQLLIDEGERSSRDPIAQAAHDGAGKVYQYYFSTFKRDSLDGQGLPLISTVHFGSDPQDQENAAWIGDVNQMIYGDGGRIFKPLAYGIDVIGHELTHGVVQYTADLVYETQSGALNESYADVFGVLISGADWEVGRDVVKSPPYPLPYLRSLKDPNANGAYNPRNPLAGVGQPASMAEYANLPNSRRSDNGGVHINSGIPSRAAYLVAQALGKDKMQQIYFRTMTQYLTPESDFLDAGNATARAAADLYGQTEVGAVRTAFDQVGINIGGSDTTPQAPSPGNQPPPNTPPPPSEPQQDGCTDLIVNGTFESDAGWKQVTATSTTSIIDPELPHTGKRSAWLGGTDQEAFQYIYQDVNIPANATNVKVSYFRNVHRETTGLFGFTAADAKFDIVLANSQGDTVASLESLTSAQGDDRWTQKTFDLSRYAGKSVRLVFAAENPRKNVSSMFVDDVSLVGCTTGTGPAAPPTSSGDQVYVQGTISDASTGRGVSGAQIFFLKPGLTASDAAADGNITDDEVLTMGTADNTGVYQSEEAIPRGQTYSAIVIASGYRPILADDGVEIPSDAENPFPVDATVRQGR